MIPRYRARLDLRQRDACVTMDGVFSCAREWIAAVERAEVPALAPGSVRLASGSVVEVLQHVHDGRHMAALRYDRTSPSGAWRTEVGFEPTEDGGRVFVEISSGVQDRVAPSGRRQAPRLTMLLVSRYAASAGIPLLGAPIAVFDRSGVDSLLSMLTDGSRRISIVGVAVGDAPGTPLVNEAVQLQRQLMGLAQLAVLGGD